MRTWQVGTENTADDPLLLRGKRAVVIGGTTGIGRAIALGLAQAGMNVVASARSQPDCATIAAEIQALGRDSMEAAVDVTRRESVQALHDLVLSEWDSIDVLVNCAGVTRRVPTIDVSEELWAHILDVNLTGTLRACQVFGRSMIERGRGRIINIASLATFVGFHEVTPYAASKAGVGALTRSLAVEWARHGIAVNAIAPGIFPTALNTALLDSPRGHELTIRTPMARFGAADELVSTALYLASERSSFTTGQIIAVDGGFLASGVNQ